METNSKVFFKRACVLWAGDTHTVFCPSFSSTVVKCVLLEALHVQTHTASLDSLCYWVLQSSGVACFLLDFPQTLKLHFLWPVGKIFAFLPFPPFSERMYRLNSHPSQFRNGSLGCYGQNIDVAGLWGVLCSCDFNFIFRHSCLCLNPLNGRLGVNHAVLTCALVCVSL